MCIIFQFIILNSYYFMALHYCWLGVSRWVFLFLQNMNNLNRQNNTLTSLQFWTGVQTECEVNLTPSRCIDCWSVFAVCIFFSFQTANTTTIQMLDVTSLRIKHLLCVLSAPITICMAAQSLTDLQTSLLVCYFILFFCVVICKHTFFVKVIINNITLRACSVVLSLPHFGMTVQSSRGFHIMLGRITSTKWSRLLLWSHLRWELGLGTSLLDLFIYWSF